MIAPNTANRFAELAAQSYLAAPDINPERPLRVPNRPRSKQRRLNQGRRRALQAAGYLGGQKRRPTSNWAPGGGSADEDILTDLPTLRDRCRDLARNNALAAGAVETYVDNVVGSGMELQSRIDWRILGWAEDDPRIEQYELALEGHWRQCRGALDAADVLEFGEMTRLIWQQRLENGEVLAYRQFIDEPNRPCGLAWDIIEADRLATPVGVKVAGTIRDGVEKGPRGEPLAYWISKTHPGDLRVANQPTKRGYLRIPRYDSAGRPNILHLYAPTRPAQSRGVPLLAPVIDALKQMVDYLDAEVVAAHVGACFATAITSQDPYSFAQDRADSDEGKSTQDEPIESWEPGMNYYLDEGEKIEMIDPKRPNASAGAFVEMFVRLIGAALNLPYELILKDFSKTNYSSARAALLEARRRFRVGQQWLIRRWCQPTWDLLVEEAVIDGVLPISLAEFNANRYAWTRAKWLTQRWGWVDPVKEIRAWVEGIKEGIATRADACSENGDDWEEQTAQQEREVKRREAAGLSTIEAAQPAAPSPAFALSGADQ